MKDISLRPKKPLMILFEGIKRLESLPSINRNAIVERALNVAETHEFIDWRSVSEVVVDEIFEEKIPAHIVLKVDEVQFEKITAQIKATYTDEKITIPYTLKLLLTLYFIHLTQQTQVATKDENINKLKLPELEINTIILKNEYDQLMYPGKKRLLELCKTILSTNPDIETKLNASATQDLKSASTFLDLDPFLPDSLKQNVPTVNYIAKILAGLFVIHIESITNNGENKVLFEQLLKHLEFQFQTVGHAIDSDDSADYYKNVYAKMMGGKI